MINEMILLLILCIYHFWTSTYGVYISQLIRFARESTHIDDFNTHNKVLTEKILKLSKAFSKFYQR